jgi:hypothetical protein
MYYAYQPSTPLNIIQKYHLLAINPMKGPKMRCNVPLFLEIYEPKDLLPAIDHLKNYPSNSIILSHLKDSVLSKRRIHISLTNNDEIENEVISYANNKWKDTSGGHLNDHFSQLIMNSDLNSPQKVAAVQARYTLKQLWEECCAKVDDKGPEGVKELENQLLLFRGYCNRMNGADGNNQLGTGDNSMTTPPRRNIPMTHGKYGGSAETHNM